MESIETGYVAEPIPGEATKGMWEPMDPFLMLLFCLALWSGTDFKGELMETVANKAKEAMDHAKQSIPEIEQPAADAE